MVTAERVSSMGPERVMMREERSLEKMSAGGVSGALNKFQFSVKWSCRTYRS